MRCPFAEWQGPADSNYRPNGMVYPLRGFVLHVIVGSLEAADSVFKRSGWNASAHFGVGRSGRTVQWVDTADRAWAEGAGNPYWLSVETEGMPSEALTPAQVSAVARLFAWGQVHGPYPYEVTDSPTGRGLGTHQMGGAAWGGHACPGGPRSAQRAEIIRQASGGVVTPVPTPAPTPGEETKMLFYITTQGKGLFVTDGVTKAWVRNGEHKGALDNLYHVYPTVFGLPPAAFDAIPTVPGGEYPGDPKVC